MRIAMMYGGDSCNLMWFIEGCTTYMICIKCMFHGLDADRYPNWRTQRFFLSVIPSVGRWLNLTQGSKMGCCCTTDCRCVYVSRVNIEMVETSTTTKCMWHVFNLEANELRVSTSFAYHGSPLPGEDVMGDSYQETIHVLWSITV